MYLHCKEGAPTVEIKGHKLGQEYDRSASKPLAAERKTLLAGKNLMCGPETKPNIGIIYPTLNPRP